MPVAPVYSVREGFGKQRVNAEGVAGCEGCELAKLFRVFLVLMLSDEVLVLMRIGVAGSALGLDVRQLRLGVRESLLNILDAIVADFAVFELAADKAVKVVDRFVAFGLRRIDGIAVSVEALAREELFGGRCSRLHVRDARVCARLRCSREGAAAVSVGAGGEVRLGATRRP